MKTQITYTELKSNKFLFNEYIRYIRYHDSDDDLAKNFTRFESDFRGRVEQQFTGRTVDVVNLFSERYGSLFLQAIINDRPNFARHLLQQYRPTVYSAKDYFKNAIIHKAPLEVLNYIYRNCYKKSYQQDTLDSSLPDFKDEYLLLTFQYLPAYIRAAFFNDHNIDPALLPNDALGNNILHYAARQSDAAELDRTLEELSKTPGLLEKLLRTPNNEGKMPAAFCKDFDHMKCFAKYGVAFTHLATARKEEILDEYRAKHDDKAARSGAIASALTTAAWIIGGSTYLWFVPHHIAILPTLTIVAAVATIVGTIALAGLLTAGITKWVNNAHEEDLASKCEAEIQQISQIKHQTLPTRSVPEDLSAQKVDQKQQTSIIYQPRLFEPYPAAKQSLGII